MKVNAYAALEPKGKLTPYSYELGKIGSEQVDIKVSHWIAMTDKKSVQG